ncbi:hypothetical protein UPYG_G00177150 [Umbra pygmaea]|uniref:Zinc-finger domain-containing protein n=1 Tax=Umbra pygmaea TaxID=75934 RepID=A0ABD0X6S5_UMBPY
MDKTGDFGMSSFSNQLAEIFAEESDHENTFYGFSDSDSSDDKKSNSDTPEETKGSPLKQPAHHRFMLRVALRPRKPATTMLNTSQENEVDKALKKPKIKAEEVFIKHVKFEIDDKPVTVVTKHVQQQSDSDFEADDPPQSDSFLSKRAENIKANKAMLAQLMADLRKMPGDDLLKVHRGNLKKKKVSQVPRSKYGGGESRRNPERSSQRRTRSMGGAEGGAGSPPKRELELSLEEELLEIRGEPKQRGALRPKQTKPHIVRPVEEVTEDELQLVADNTTEKVYNSATGSTCHQCRQKTIDTKTCCRNEECHGILGQFCGPCLRNRYGEDVRKALLDPEWRCPPCRGICNCSFCRARDGRCPTGILFPLAQYHGFSDVHSYLSSLRSKLNSGEDSEEL